MSTQAGSYLYRCSALLTDAQLSGEYFGGFLARVRDGRHPLCSPDADGDEERGGRTAPRSGVNESVEVPPSPLPHVSCSFLPFLFRYSCGTVAVL